MPIYLTEVGEQEKPQIKKYSFFDQNHILVQLHFQQNYKYNLHYILLMFFIGLTSKINKTGVFH